MDDYLKVDDHGRYRCELPESCMGTQSCRPMGVLLKLPKIVILGKIVAACDRRLELSLDRVTRKTVATSGTF